MAKINELRAMLEPKGREPEDWPVPIERQDLKLLLDLVEIFYIVGPDEELGTEIITDVEILFDALYGQIQDC